MATDRALRWLRAYFGAPAGWNGELPEAVCAWARPGRAFRETEDDVPRSEGPLVVGPRGERDEKSLV